MHILGLDIGGANLKAACHGWATSRSFALWQKPAHLAAALRELLASAPLSKALAITMTGELCDCFRTKVDGVFHILDAVETAAPGMLTAVYLVDGRCVPVKVARSCPELAAASNWHALAAFAGRFADCASAVLIDIGSTTTDIIPLENGLVATPATSDTDRLIRRELVYFGVRRTPVCAMVESLPWGDLQCPVAAELFATAADAYVLLGDILEQPESNDTADGRPLTQEYAHERLARMICTDHTLFHRDAAISAARAIQDAQLGLLKTALEQVVAGMARPPERFITSGAGEFLAHRLIQNAFPGSRVLSLAERLGPVFSDCAPAYAVAILAEEQGIFESR